MKRPVVAVGASAAIAFGVFVALAQTTAIQVPYLTPARIEFEGLENQYPVNGSMNYIISIKGYGSNCIDFEAQVIRQDRVEERIAYYGEVQDCRRIEIAQGPYNYTKSFSYGGATVLSAPGNYKVEINVLDQITKQAFAETRSFIVIEDSI